MFWAQFHDWCVQKWSCLLLSWDAFWKFLPDEVYEESFGCIFTIHACKNEAVSCEVQTHFASFHLVRYITKVMGALSRFLHPQTKPVCCWVEMHFGSFCLMRFMKKVLGALSLFLCPKTELFAVKFRRILKVLRIQGLQKDFWAHFHDLCDQKRSCLQWSSDAFWKFFACKFCRKGSGHISTINASKNEAVCHEVQTHFGSSPHSRFTKRNEANILHEATTPSICDVASQLQQPHRMC